ncbi:MAG: aminotransferase class I/II-fold pyridoxal phosphate-dependent enzyme [Candidatus Gastranaerophilaceae bacterium]|nr:aminotransferase class I/II-fold pyridoxal phosphate-dependent enzyme [Christensenellales bacterium]
MKTGLYPYFHALETAQDTEVMMEGRRTIMLGSNNYLGLTNDPRTIKAAHEALDRYGTGCSGSRFLNGTLKLHLELEEELAEFFHKDGVITFSTGFQSNLGIISAIATRQTTILNDSENHASILDACRLSFAKNVYKYEHNNMESLEDKISRLPIDSPKLIITDGVFSMSGDIANLPEIVRIKNKYNARLMVDDAHGVGMIGNGGRGTASYFDLENEVDIIMTTFSKSFASLGGCVAAREDVINYIKHNSRPFIFSASIPPANAASALCALRILKESPERVDDLMNIAEYMRGKLREINLPIIEGSTAIIPIITYDLKRTLTIAKRLLEEGVYVNPVLPPAVPSDMCLLRTSYTATHTMEQMDHAAKIFDRVFKEIG